MTISGDFSAILAVIDQTAEGKTTDNCTTAGSIRGLGGEVPVVCAQRSLTQANTSEFGIDRKYVTVLVIEIVNPLHAFGGIDPELILRQVDPLLESAREVIELNGGVITTSGECGITAIFSTLPASRHHALSASRAALVVKSKLELQSNCSIRVRAGLDTGEMIVQHRSRGATNQIEVMGSAIRTATRLAQSLRRGAVAITVRTRVAADGLLNVVRLSRSELIGFDRDEKVYELKSATAQ
jgi:class 3 adenylate cyclase